ncbi:MAG: hypothetical protein HY855_14865 [Burkholderiales bacterium]|nr:hypothetical protein [Burkholderiales bacterium]
MSDAARPAGPEAVLRRRQRKHDLLLASRLARGQAMLAFDQLAGRADGMALQVLRVRAWLSNPLVVAAGGAVVGLGLVLTLRRVRRGGVVRVLRWGWLAWRLWRGATGQPGLLSSVRQRTDRAWQPGHPVP